MYKNMVLLITLILCTPTMGAASMDTHDKTTEFVCAFEKDHNPPLDLNSAAHKLYQQALEFQNSKPVLTDAEQANITLMYKEAADQGHWKAKAQLIPRYLDGIGIGRNDLIAVRLTRELMRQEIPIGYFNYGLFTRKGWGTPRDEKEGMELIHKAAALGSKDAQYMLGEYYIYTKNDDVRGLKYHVCAMRQGLAKSASAIASYLEIVDKNYPMNVEYLLRGGGLGNKTCFNVLNIIFSSDNPNSTHGFANNAKLANLFYKNYTLLDQKTKLTFPNIGKECPLPKHPTLGDGRQLPSKLKEACGGKWPDEAYPELKNW